MHQNGADAGVDTVQDALGLAEGIAEQHAGFFRCDIGPPPLIDLGEHLRLGLPAVNRQTEGRLGDEGVATHRFEWRAGAVGLDLVIPGRDPDFAAVFQAHLGRAKHVAGRVKTQGDAVMQQAFAVGQGLQVDVLTQARAQNPFAGRGRQVMLITGAGMIAVGVGNHRAFHRTPRVDIEIPGGAVQTFGARDNKIHVVTKMEGFVSYEVCAWREVLSS